MKQLIFMFLFRLRAREASMNFMKKPFSIKTTLIKQDQSQIPTPPLIKQEEGGHSTKSDLIKKENHASV